MTDPYTHPDYLAQLAGIIAVPADDLRRLVLCDWLEELQEDDATARAEFIRVQCELASRPGCGHPARRVLYLDGTCSVCPLLRRQSELWGEHGREWFGDTALWLSTDKHERASPHVAGYIVQRGFPAVWRGPLADWCGSECGRCRTWTIGRRGERPACGACHSTGRTVGIGAAVVAAHPVERVVLTSMPPRVLKSGWAAVCDSDLTPEVWVLITAQFPGHGNAQTKWFESKQKRDAAVSAALIAWAKRQNEIARNPKAAFAARRMYG